MKKKLIIFMIIGALSGAIFATGIETKSTVKLNAYVQETDGLVVSKDVSDLNSNINKFDSVFNTFNNELIFDDSTINTATEDSTGKFSVLVRRNVNENMKVDVSATPLINEEYSEVYLNYELSLDDSTTDSKTSAYITKDVSSLRYTIENPGENNTLRNQTVFTYKIPKDTNALKGKYHSTITFELATV